MNFLRKKSFAFYRLSNFKSQFFSSDFKSCIPKLFNETQKYKQLIRIVPLFPPNPNLNINKVRSKRIRPTCQRPKQTHRLSLFKRYQRK